MDYLNLIMERKKKLSRREFLKLSGIALGGLALGSGKAGQVLANSSSFFQDEPLTPDFPQGTQLGRVCVGEPGAHFDIKTEPYWEAPSAGTAWRDDVFVWKSEVVASQIDGNRINQRWVETPEGYIYADYIQKTRYVPQEPLTQLPEWPNGESGMWVEIVAPYTGMRFDRTPSQYWIREAIRPRLYYSQVFWAFAVRQDPTTGQLQYGLMQLYGAHPDQYWVDASVCRQITPEEVQPIHPGQDGKRIVMDIRYQTVSCYEGDEEVYFATVSSGAMGEDGDWLTPVGTHTIWRKMISTHMSAGPAVGNYDIAGIAWTTLFDNEGAAIHSTFWHNYFGTARSHGCVNARPEDAKWIWRWSEPAVPYYPGELTIQGMDQSTKVTVIEP